MCLPFPRAGAPFTSPSVSAPSELAHRCSDIRSHERLLQRWHETFFECPSDAFDMRPTVFLL